MEDVRAQKLRRVVILKERNLRNDLVRAGSINREIRALQSVVHELELLESSSGFHYAPRRFVAGYYHGTCRSIDEASVRYERLLKSIRRRRSKVDHIEKLISEELYLRERQKMESELLELVCTQPADDLQ